MNPLLSTMPNMPNMANMQLANMAAAAGMMPPVSRKKVKCQYLFKEF